MPPADEPDLRPTVITGATSGIGFEVARGLARSGRAVVLVGRDRPRTERVAAQIATETGRPVQGLVADLSEMAEVRRLGGELVARFPAIRALVNDAGALFVPRARTSEGLERTWALNVLAPYLLTRLILPSLTRAGSARVVNVASAAHRTALLDLGDLELVRHYRGYRAYARSKLALVMLTGEFARRIGTPELRFVSCHPGFVASRFALDNPRWFRAGWRFATTIAGISPARGARAPLRLLTAGLSELESGGYYSRGRFRRPSRAAEDRATAGRLWNACAAMVGLADP